jgi:hypothetical protein
MTVAWGPGEFFFFSWDPNNQNSLHKSVDRKTPRFDGKK